LLEGPQEPLLPFSHPTTTASGEKRAWVKLLELKTLWFNTGSLCNLSCENCYMESSPRNDSLVYLELSDVLPFLKEIEDPSYSVEALAFTGGEPFLNPQILAILSAALATGRSVLVLTNAVKAMDKHKAELLKLKNSHGAKLRIRVSMDHYTEELHEKERGKGSFRAALENIRWLQEQGFVVSVAGRSLLSESSQEALNGYQGLMSAWSIPIKLILGENFVVFPEMSLEKTVPEITTQCWGILGKRPQDQMCASERMIVKRKGEARAKVLPCTLLAYDKQFELGETLANAEKKVYLNHKYCAQFCVLGGASCSGV